MQPAGQPILGAVSQFEKAFLVAKLRGARDRASAVARKRMEGRKVALVGGADALGEARSV
jgi:hypothetical protein